MLKNDCSFASQVKKKNTVYEIRDVLELGSGTVTIPKGCTLSFKGGKLKGKGMIAGNNTTIVSSESNIIQGLSMIGRWQNSHANVSWFSDSTQQALSNAIAISDSVIVDKDLTFTNVLETSKSGLTIVSNHKKITEGIHGWRLRNVKDVKIEGIDFFGTPKYIKGSTATALSIRNGNNVVVTDCSLDGCYFYGFVFNDCQKSKLEGCHFAQSGDVVRQILAYAKLSKGIEFKNNDFKNIGRVYVIRLDYCTDSYVMGNKMKSVKNNPILINSGCSFCTVYDNYIDDSDDSGIVCANDPVWFVDEGMIKETLHAEPPHDITITRNVVKNMRDTGIGIYRDGSLNPSYSYNIIITDNELVDNGLLSTADAYKNQVFIAARKVKVSGNTMRLTKTDNSKYGVFIQSAYTAGKVYEVNDNNIEITGNTYENLTPIGSNHNSTGGADPNIVCDIGEKRIVDINLLGKMNGNLPSGNSYVNWMYPPSGYQSLLTNEKGIFTIRSTSGNTVSEIVCRFKDNRYFKNTCILMIEGYYKMEAPLKKGEKPSIVVLGTSSSGVRKIFESTTTYKKFVITALMEKDTPKIKIVGTFATNKLSLKDVKVFVQDLNEKR